MTSTIVTSSEIVESIVFNLDIKEYNSIRFFDGNKEILLSNLKAVIFNEIEKDTVFEAISLNLKPNVKEAFIQLVLSLEPERLSQDGERNYVEIEAARNEINSIWKHLEKVHNISVSQEMAEAWAWEEK